MKTQVFALGVAVVAALAAARPVQAEVARFEVTSRGDLSSFNYERIVGKAHVAVDPAAAGNKVIADLDKAPRGANGRVEATADVYILRPKSGGNGVALIDIVNRGRRTIFGFNHPNAAPRIDPATGRAAPAGVDGDLGDGFLFTQGFTIVCIGWEFDVPARDGLLRVDVPVATENGRPITGIVRTAFTPDRADASYTVNDLTVYPPADADVADAALTVRDGLTGAPTTVPRDRWRIAGNVVTLTPAFEPGRIYEVSYRASNPPVGGLGLAAVRDVASWVKYAPGAVVNARYAYAFGSSQSGRLLREFLYDGFNADEQQRQVFDGVMSHIAGASRIDVNRRWATPTGLALYNATAFPFADRAERDPVSGETDGLLDNPRSRAHQPKLFYTNTGVEYWGGGRSAALTHASIDGKKDLTLPDNVRSYFLTGAQHSPGAFPPQKGNTTQQKSNPTDYWWNLRALLVAMDHWVRDNTAPPASQYPRVDRGTLVSSKDVALPAIPGLQSPRMLIAGIRIANPLLAKGAGEGAALPLLVPQVDSDGNERAGIRLPEVAVPLATYTGWNFRDPAVGGSDQLVPLIGSYVPFASTRGDRDARRDPRPSIEERYPSRDRYLALVNESAAGLVKGGYLLADDVAAVVKRATDHWELLVPAAVRSTASR